MTDDPRKIVRQACEQAAEKVDIADLTGKLVKASKGEMRGVCLLCGTGSNKGSFQFVVYVAARRWYCHGDCQRGGDVVDLYRALHPAYSPFEAAKELLGGSYERAALAQPKKAATPAPDSEATKRIAAELWNEADPAPLHATPAWRYYAARAISNSIVVEIGPDLRFNRRAKRCWDPDMRAWSTAPAVVGRLRTPQGETGGVHVTYLKRDGQGFFAKPIDKRMWGPQALNGVWGGVWLIGPEQPSIQTPPIVGEGCETTLSAADFWLARMGRVPRAVAALSLDRLQGWIARDEDGCMDVYDPSPDPARPPFTWPMLDGAPGVLIAVDRDMAPVTVKARTGRDKPCAFTLDSEARAKLCGQLAVKAWRAAGWPKATALVPPPGTDFNTALRQGRIGMGR